MRLRPPGAAPAPAPRRNLSSARRVGAEEDGVDHGTPRQGRTAGRQAGVRSVRGAGCCGAVATSADSGQLGVCHAA